MSSDKKDSLNPYGVRVKEVECEFRNKCVNFGISCNTCKNNKGTKDYYEPQIPYTPYIPWNAPTLTWKLNSANGIGT